MNFFFGLIFYTYRPDENSDNFKSLGISSWNVYKISTYRKLIKQKDHFKF